MADRLQLPLYHGRRQERNRTRMFNCWCLPGRSRNIALAVGLVLASFAALTLFTSHRTPPPSLLVQQEWSGGAGKRVLSVTSAGARRGGGDHLGDDAEEEVNVARDDDDQMKWTAAPLVLDEAAGDSSPKGKHDVEDYDGSISGPLGVVEREGMEDVHMNAEDNLPANADIGAKAAEGHDTLLGGQEAGPELQGGAASLMSDPPTAGTTLQSKTSVSVEGEEGHQSATTSKQAESGVKEGDSAEREGEGGSVDKQKSFTGADVKKQGYVKKMMEHAWNSYVQYAWGADELDPLSKAGKSSGIFGHSQMGATIVDSLDTLHVMGLTEEFGRAREWVEKRLDFDRPKTAVSLFEYNIRFLGGLLSAYAFTKDEVFKTKAADLADRLIPTFNTPSGIPCGSVNLNLSRTEQWQPCSSSIPLAELGSLHLEWMYLTTITGEQKYFDKVKRVRDRMQSLQKQNGLFYTTVSVTHGSFTSSQATIGAPADSFYEYLIKSWVMTSKKDTQAADMYFKVMKAFEANILQTTNDGFKYFAEMLGSSLVHRMGHLACFAGGMLALTALNTEGERREHFLSLAGDITATCHESYSRTETHIGPEVMSFVSGRMINSNNPMYILRPETVESYFYMWRATHDPKYREWGWEAVQAIDKHCRTDSGYAGLRNVYKLPPDNDNCQQSFFLAETLKYLYLLFSDDSVIPLDKWVFNTEAHPLPVLQGEPSSST